MLHAVFAAAGWLESCEAAAGSGAQAHTSGEAAGAVAAAVSAAVACALRWQSGSGAAAAGVQQRQRSIATGMDILAQMLLTSSPPAGGVAPAGGAADSVVTRAGSGGSAAGGSAGSPAAAEPSASARQASGGASSPVHRAALQHGAVEALVAALPTAAGMPEDAIEDELRGALAALAAVAEASRRCALNNSQGRVPQSRLAWSSPLVRVLGRSAAVAIAHIAGGIFIGEFSLNSMFCFVSGGDAPGSCAAPINTFMPSLWICPRLG